VRENTADSAAWTGTSVQSSMKSLSTANLTFRSEMGQGFLSADGHAQGVEVATNGSGEINDLVNALRIELEAAEVSP